MSNKFRFDTVKDCHSQNISVSNLKFVNETKVCNELLARIIQILRKKKYTPSRDELVNILKASQNPRVLTEVLKTFLVIGDEKIPEVVIDRLYRYNRGTEDEAALVISEFGTIRNIRSLFKLQSETANSLLKRKLESAIEDIKKKAAVEMKGSFTMTKMDDLDGALSTVAESSEGGLSLKKG